MSEQNFPQIQNTDQRALDSTSALEKVLRLDRKHTNFDYYDTLRNVSFRVSYPQITTQGPNTQNLLRSLWRHVGNYYFKKIEESQLQRFNYLRTLLPIHNQGNIYIYSGKLRFDGSPEFWSIIERTFSTQYLQQYLKGQNELLNYHNWLEHLYIQWELSEVTDGKEAKKKLAHIKNLKENIQAIYSGTGKQIQKLKYQSQKLFYFLPEEEQIEQTQVMDQIIYLEQQLLKISDQNYKILDRMIKRVEHQTSSEDKMYCVNNQDEEEELTEIADRDNLKKIERQLQKINSCEAQTKYIQQLIRKMQKKQIAESVSKLVRVQKIKGQTRITLFFQESMGIKPIVVSEKEFKEINDLREYSLLKFYNTAAKTKYTFVCQNYLGFKDMHENRHNTCKFKNRDMLQIMKKSPQQHQNAGCSKQFGRMEICHHCKLLHPDTALVKCQYKSTRCGNPIPPSPFFDSYIYQILKNQQSRTYATRFINCNSARKNSYFHYEKKDQQYVCERKYCKYCLKNYEAGKQKAIGLCPYCRAICYCTRCSRNEMMIRLKSMYLLMGGDINKLQRQSYLQRFYQPGQEIMGLRKQDHSGKSSRRSSSGPNRMNDKMTNIRYQLEDLRIISDLVKRRQKKKQTLFNNRKEIFRKKIQIICADFMYKHLDNSTHDQLENKQDQEIKIRQKISKKLKRMIS